MGLNGAFLTGDLFNLFVFFEVMLAASYGMALHGSGTARVRAGLHYIVINLVASLLFLVGVSVVYGIAGTLNLADLAVRMRDVAAADRALLEAGLAVLGIAFLVKAAMWPLGFWLPGTYAAAGAPAAAILSMLSKVGIYAVLRVWLLLFGEGAGDSAGFGAAWIMAGGLLTIAFGSIAVLASQNVARLAGASVLVSSGTLLAAVGAEQVAVTGGALFYLANSVLAIGAFFLLIELVERNREVGADVLAVTREAFGTGEEDDELEGRDEVGVPIPGAVAILGISFLACALLLAGLPPLSGFLAKFAILAPLLAPAEGGVPASDLGAARGTGPVRAGDHHRHGAYRDRRLLGLPGGHHSARRPHRGGTDRAAADPLLRADGRRRAGHGVHAGRRGGAACPAGLPPGRACDVGSRPGERRMTGAAPLPPADALAPGRLAAPGRQPLPGQHPARRGAGTRPVWDPHGPGAPEGAAPAPRRRPAPPVGRARGDRPIEQRGRSDHPATGQEPEAALRLRAHPARHAQPLWPGGARLHPYRDARHGLGGLRRRREASCCSTCSTSSTRTRGSASSRTGGSGG